MFQFPTGLPSAAMAIVFTDIAQLRAVDSLNMHTSMIGRMLFRPDMTRANQIINRCFSIP